MVLATKQKTLPGGTTRGIAPAEERVSNESAANTELTVSTVVGSQRRLLQVTVKYSAGVTKDVTVTLNSGAGAAFDTLLRTIKFVVSTEGIWTPERQIFIFNDDVIDVVAPAGGAGVTSAVAIYTGVL